MNILATAFVSSLGRNADIACAAARAGLSRASELQFTILENDRAPGLAIGHPVPLIGAFQGDGRLVRLLAAAFHDLLERIPEATLQSARIGFYLAIPAWNREREGLPLIIDDRARARYVEGCGHGAQIDDVARGRRILAGALALARLPRTLVISATMAFVSTRGHTAAIELFDRARTDLQAGSTGIAFVAAVDSLVEFRALRWLYATHRLKGAESPAGLAPGEAAALIALSGRSTAREQSVTVDIDHIAQSESASQFLLGHPADGKGQSEVMRQLTGAIGGFTGREWAITDQNGEAFRASDWGCSLVRLGKTRIPADSGGQVWLPAGSFGDVGAATGAVATCVAVRAFERGYAPARNVLIMTNSDGASRAGCVLSQRVN